MIFLSIRGETELALIDEGAISDENDTERPLDGHGQEVSESVSTSGRRPSRRWSIRRSPGPRRAARASFAAANFSRQDEGEARVCRVPRARRAVGDGPSFVTQDVFNRVVFGGNPSERRDADRGQLDDKTKELWDQKLDEWGNPLRPG